MIVLKLAWRNIWRNKRRTLITISSIFFAVILSSLLMSIKDGMHKHMIQSTVGTYYGYIQINHSEYTIDNVLDNGFIFSDELRRSLNDISDIDGYIPRIESFALAATDDQNKGTLVVGTDLKSEKEFTGIAKKVIKGTFLTPGDNGVLVGKGLAEYLKINQGDTLILIGQGYHGASAAGKYPVRGIIAFGSPELSKQLVLMSLESAQKLYSCPGVITQINIWPKNNNHSNDLLAKLQSAAGEHMDVRIWEEVMPEISKMLEADKAEGYVFIFILYLVISFGIFGTILMMLIERSYEFGMMVSIGMKRIKLAVMVWIEALTLSLTGAAAGILGAIPVCYYFYINPIKFGGDISKTFEEYGFEAIMKASMDVNIFINQAIIIAILSSLLSAYPFFRILKMNPLNAMKV
jgi:ABC-type lipoprotein release transport system permease subunit